MMSSNGNIFRVTGRLCREFTGHPHNRQWRGPLMFSLICAWIDGLVNNGEAGNLRRYRAQYDVIVMQDWLSRLLLKRGQIYGVIYSATLAVTQVLVHGLWIHEHFDLMKYT